MRYIERTSLNLDGASAVKGDLELGDLTILIGKANSGKTRILEYIFGILYGIQSVPANTQNLQTFEEQCRKKGINLVKGIGQIFTTAYIQSNRSKVENIGGLSLKLAKSASSLKIIDPQIYDWGTDKVQYNNGIIRPLKEQGSGVHHLIQVLDKLHQQEDIVLIDEPEISQFPYGKIEIIRNVIESLQYKQIVLATHDPTIINQYLIKKFMGNNQYKIIIYSFSGGHFEKIDFSSNNDPEIHAGYLSQTYSGKPVHLIIEGLTEYYTFQALFVKYCVYNKINHFPKFINKISLTHIAGSQWKIHLDHLPDGRYYDTLLLLDGEHTEDILKLPKDERFKICENIDNVENGKINIFTFNSVNFDEVFHKVFNQKFDKPLQLSQHIWSLSEEDFKKINFDKQNIGLIRDIINWCLFKTGCTEFQKGKSIENAGENLKSLGEYI